MLFVVAKRDFTDSDCVFVALLSHGDEGVIYGTDGPVQYEQIFSLFKPPEVNKSLVGKPKIFLIQVRSEFITRSNYSLILPLLEGRINCLVVFSMNDK